MINQDLVGYMADMVMQYVPNVKRKSDTLNFRCPICGDGKKSSSKRGYFYLSTGSYYCWNGGCPANGSGMDGISFISNVSGMDRSEVIKELVRRAGSFNSVEINKELSRRGMSDLFMDCKEIAKRNREVSGGSTVADFVADGKWTYDLPEFARMYVEERKIMKAPYLPDGFKMAYDIQKRRLVIPWGNGYYQERKLYKNQDGEDKYLFPYGIEKPIFGLEKIDPCFKYIFLLEGVFDSIWVKNGLAVGSLTLSNHQMEMLKPYADEFEIVYMMDNQYADRSSLDKTLQIARENPFQKVYIWDRRLSGFKDVNESVIGDERLVGAWKSERFLLNGVANGVSIGMKLKK